MQDTTKTSLTSSPIRKTQHRRKANSFTVISKLPNPRERLFLQEFTVQISPTIQKRINLQTFTNYTHQLVQQIYGQDKLGIAKMVSEFLEHQLPKFRQRLQERLSLSNYLIQSLKYKPFGEVQKQILKQWRKNVIFFSLNTIWSTKIQTHKFTAIESFRQEYKKQIALIANLTHYYFKDALSILDGKNVATFSYLQEETAHRVLNQMHDWKNIYERVVVQLIRVKNGHLKHMMDLDYDPRNLNINEQYMDLDSGKVELPKTIEKIRELAHEYRIHQKIELLKQMRSTFIQEIDQNRVNIMKYKKREKMSPLEKDDVIGCMIYCIVTGKIKEIQHSIEAIGELLGANNELLSRKGVDSYRADLQSAIGYLCQQGEVKLITLNKELHQSQILLQMANKSTHLQLDCK